MFNHFYKTAADINLFLYVGAGFIQETIADTLAAYGETYSEDLVDQIQNEILQYDTVLEEQLVQEGWADVAVVQFDSSYGVHGTIDYEDVETPLDDSELDELEKIVEDFVMPFVEEAVSHADVEDLIWIPVQSSNVESFAYDPQNRFFYVRFLPSGRGSFSEGSTYVYYGVEAAIYDQFFQAPSKGQAVWQLLRDRYDYERLS